FVPVWTGVATTEPRLHVHGASAPDSKPGLPSRLAAAAGVAPTTAPATMARAQTGAVRNRSLLMRSLLGNLPYISSRPPGLPAGPRPVGPPGSRARPAAKGVAVGVPATVGPYQSAESGVIRASPEIRSSADTSACTARGD